MSNSLDRKSNTGSPGYMPHTVGFVTTEKGITELERSPQRAPHPRKDVALPGEACAVGVLVARRVGLLMLGEPRAEPRPSMSAAEGVPRAVDILLDLGKASTISPATMVLSD